MSTWQRLSLAKPMSAKSLARRCRRNWLSSGRIASTATDSRAVRVKPSKASSDEARARTASAASPRSFSSSIPATAPSKGLEASHAKGSNGCVSSLLPPSAVATDTWARPSPSIQTPQSVPSMAGGPVQNGRM